jgi:hypothetical protein
MAYVVVQEIKVEWGAAERGAEAATERNAIPEALSLPSIPETDCPNVLIYDQVTFHKGIHHEVRTEELVARSRHYWGCVGVYWDGEQVIATYAYNGNCAGAPERTSYPRDVLHLTAGAWGRIRYNGRWARGWRAIWRYHKTVLNIGYIDTVGEDLFMGQPVSEFSDMADLW